MPNFFTNLFAKASELTRLDNEVGWLRSEVKRKDAQLQLAEEALEKERKAHNTALRRTADLICRQQKLPEHFVADLTPKEPPKPEEPDPKEVERIAWAARAMRDDDIANGRDVPSLDTYIEAIKKDPDFVFVDKIG